MLAALSVVREKELGSIINLYVTPVTRSEFLLGKQLPYVLLGMLNFGLLTLLAVKFDLGYVWITLGALVTYIAFTVTVKLVPAVRAVGAPVLPVAVPPAAVSPGIST